MGQPHYHLAANELNGKPHCIAKPTISMCKTVRDARLKALFGKTERPFNADKATIVNLYYHCNC